MLKEVFRSWCIIFCSGILLINSIHAQTQRAAPNLNSDIPWPSWWYDNSVSDVEAQFNVGRRGEESQKGLATGALGNLVLPSDFLDRPFDEQALILINSERQARAGVNYPNHGTVSGLLLEGVERDISQVAQDHADDMQERDYFAHNTQGGPSWSTRISNEFPGCTEGMSENIAWNSISSQGGFILGIPLAIYGFIYDDSCCNWGHRKLCLKQSGYNNYGDPNKLGLVGFGRGTGSTGDYFVMDYIDPKPSCTYNIKDFGGCEEIVVLNGTIQSGVYQANAQLSSTNTIANGGEVTFMAGNEISMMASFEVQAGATLDAYIEACNGSALRENMTTSDLATEKVAPVIPKNGFTKKSHQDTY